jgi:outer membrane protein assembly factor BamD (BamD/ComL family)
MLPKLALLALPAVLLTSFGACKKEPPDNLAVKVEKFRKEQRQKEIKAYRDLVEKYPDSPYTAQAREALEKLAPAAPPKK